MRLPGILTGTNPLVGWLNALRECVAASIITSVVGGRIERGAWGTVIHVGPGGSGSGPTQPGGSAEKFRIKSYSGTYITCRTWDGTTEGSTDIKVALPPEIRDSITSEVIDNDTYTYAYTTATQSRVSTRSSDSATETEYLTPRFIVDQEILAIKVTGNTTVSVGGTPLEYQAITGREWAAVYA